MLPQHGDRRPRAQIDGKSPARGEVPRGPAGKAQARCAGTDMRGEKVMADPIAIKADEQDLQEARYGQQSAAR